MESIPAIPDLCYIPQQPHMNRVRNIILEAVEVAFIICNSRKRVFDINIVRNCFRQMGPYNIQGSASTIATLISSNIPTAFVLNTAYWVFYFSNIREGALCVCNRYRGGICRHVIENNYWITYERSKSIKFTWNRTIPILERSHIGYMYAVPKDISVDINQIDHFGTLEVYIHFYVKLLPNNIDNSKKDYTNGSCDYLVDNRKLPKHVIKTRFRIITEYETAEQLILFFPHPAMHSKYGYFIPELLNNYTYLSSYGHMKLIPEMHKLCALEIPPFTLIMEYLSTWSIIPMLRRGLDSTNETQTPKDDYVWGENKRYCNNNYRMNRGNAAISEEEGRESSERSHFSSEDNRAVNEKNMAIENEGASPKGRPKQLPDLLDKTWRNDLSSKNEQLSFINGRFFELTEGRQNKQMEGVNNVGQQRATYASIIKRVH